jgi:hypothetical protein
MTFVPNNQEKSDDRKRIPSSDFVVLYTYKEQVIFNSF